MKIRDRAIKRYLPAATVPLAILVGFTANFSTALVATGIWHI